jgi:small subunit ribosomal protein S20
MANTKSAKKNVLLNQRNRSRNLHYKSKMKTFIKKAVLAIENNVEDKVQVLRDALRTIDKTVSAGVLKKTSAARKKSRLTLLYNKFASGHTVETQDAPKAKKKTKAAAAPAKKAATVKKAKPAAKAAKAK